MTPFHNPVKFLPNQEGFEFYAYLCDGTEVKTIIKRACIILTNIQIRLRGVIYEQMMIILCWLTSTLASLNV